jgi:hypothetical protein
MDKATLLLLVNEAEWALRRGERALAVRTLRVTGDMSGDPKVETSLNKLADDIEANACTEAG